MEDPFAALDSLANVLQNEEDPFAALAALGGREDGEFFCILLAFV